jgi:signal peptidase I
MAAVLPGFGQLYNGEINKALWLFMAFLFVNVPFLALALSFSGPLLVPLLLLTLLTSLGIWIFGMRDARRVARSLQVYQPPRWQVSSLYPLIFVLCNLIALPFLTVYVRAHLVEPFRIPSASMMPTVLQGDFLSADKRYNCPACKSRITRGDVAVFVNPNDRTQLFIKRVIALPGDRVQIAGRDVRVNGLLLASAAGAGAGERTERSADGRECARRRRRRGPRRIEWWHRTTGPEARTTPRPARPPPATNLRRATPRGPARRAR